jgi:hypothetical protein
VAAVDSIIAMGDRVVGMTTTEIGGELSCEASLFFPATIHSLVPGSIVMKLREMEGG